MTSALNCETLKHQLHTDTNSCQALLKLLSDEREALSARDHDQLDQIIQAKALHLQHLENSANTRTQWALALKQGQKDPTEAWSQIMLDQPEEVATLWLQLKELLKTCRRENEVNGKILARNEKVFSRLVSILRGQQQAQSLYNSRGGNQAQGSGHHLGEA